MWFSDGCSAIKSRLAACAPGTMILKTYNNTDVHGYRRYRRAISGRGRARTHRLYRQQDDPALDSGPGAGERDPDCDCTWQKQLDGATINSLMLDQLRQLIYIKSRALERAQQNADQTQSRKLSEELEDLDLLLSDMQIAAQKGPTMPLMDLWFKDTQEGMVIGAYGMILATTDAGAHCRPRRRVVHRRRKRHALSLKRLGPTLASSSCS